MVPGDDDRGGVAPVVTVVTLLAMVTAAVEKFTNLPPDFLAQALSGATYASEDGDKAGGAAGSSSCSRRVP